MAKAFVDFRTFAIAAVLAAGFNAIHRVFDASPQSAVNSDSPFTTRIVSTDPLILHLENFIKPDERAYLAKLGEPLFSPSEIAGKGNDALNLSLRSSSTAFLSKKDPVVKKVSERVSALQGYYELSMIDVQLTRYTEGQYYKPHHDAHNPWRNWSWMKSNRRWTIFAVIEASCSRCGTAFVELSTNWSDADPKWCELMDCDENVLTTRPIPGNALLWENLDAEHNHFPSTRHQGLPVVSGTKMGLNIWTSEPLSEMEKQVIQRFSEAENHD